jgi:hypothetical protein
MPDPEFFFFAPRSRATTAPAIEIIKDRHGHGRYRKGLSPGPAGYLAELSITEAYAGDEVVIRRLQQLKYATRPNFHLPIGGEIPI